MKILYHPVIREKPERLATRLQELRERIERIHALMSDLRRRAHNNN